jgi:hypothetical protein
MLMTMSGDLANSSMPSSFGQPGGMTTMLGTAFGQQPGASMPFAGGSSSLFNTGSASGGARSNPFSASTPFGAPALGSFGTQTFGGFGNVAATTPTAQAGATTFGNSEAAQPQSPAAYNFGIPAANPLGVQIHFSRESVVSVAAQ